MRAISRSCWMITTSSPPTPIQRGMTFLLEHLPPQLHLILVTRADPPLPLARLRAQGQLCEVRAADLRFGAAEASAFLQAVMGLDLEAAAIATLEQRTEGWIAGLQLAALSLQGRTDVSGFLATFTGTHRYVLDYLSEEVLARQPTPVQQFLLHTCILERLSGPLCDAVTEQEGSQAMLERLERANLFVVALDDERCWYRYHHLFAEVLRSHLQQREPTLPPVLHRRASAWYEQHHLPAEAVQHALAVPDVELAARLIEPIALPAAFQGQISTVLGWLNALPKALVRTHPRLCVYYARLLTFTNQLEATKELLQQAERGTQELPAEQAQTILGWVLGSRAALAALSGDVERAVSLAHQALTLLPEAEVFPRMGAIVSTALAYEVSGDVTTDSEREVAAAVALVRTSDNPFAAVSSMCLLARLYVLQGRLHQAAATYTKQVVQMVPRPEVLQTMYISLYYYFDLGDLLREWNELDKAERHLAQGMALIKETLTVDPLMNDNINSRYRQLEMPMRKGNPVATQHRKLERSMRMVVRGSCRCRGMKQRERTGRCGNKPPHFDRLRWWWVGREAVEAKCGGCERGLLSRWGWHGGGEGTAGTSSQESWWSNARQC